MLPPSRQEVTDTPNHDPKISLDQERDVFRAALVAAGFADDGEKLRGLVDWKHDGRTHTATVDVEVTERFPFAPPKVKVIDAGTTLEPTFHIECTGELCLWGSDMPVDSWQTPEKLFTKIAGWLEETARGWPGDEDADLERYLEQDDGHIILYNADAVAKGGYFRTAGDRYGIINVKEVLPWSPNPTRMKNKGVRRREHHLAWVVDVGEVSNPIRNWFDLTQAVGHDCQTVVNLIEVGSIEFILVRYRRGERDATLALGVPGKVDGLPALRAYESADTSESTRTLRSGTSAASYAKKRVAIVGCGAIGSHIADLLFRSGVQYITLIDPERLRPGNIIRHLADNSLVGLPKTTAVKAELDSLGLDTTNVISSIGRVTDPEHALQLVRAHDLVIDATADARATELLCWATNELDKRMVSVCLQRNGAIARVDRFPLWDDEHHLEPISRLPGDTTKAYEKGCGSPVSTTPPLSVVKAAALGCQSALDELNMGQYLPATIIEVINPQPDSPYNQLGVITATRPAYA